MQRRWRYLVSEILHKRVTRGVIRYLTITTDGGNVIELITSVVVPFWIKFPIKIRTLLNISHDV